MDMQEKLVAEFAIRQLLGRYVHLVDARRLDECERLFAEDAVLEVLNETYRGRSEVRRWLDTLDNYGPAGKHMVCNHVVTWNEGGPLTAISDFMVFKDIDGRWASTSRGAYHDQFLFRSDELLFQQRRIEVVFARTAVPTGS